MPIYKEKPDIRLVGLYIYKGFTKLFGNVDIHTKYMNKCVEDGILKIIFVKSEDNNLVLMTTKLSKHLHSKQSEKLIKSKFQALQKLTELQSM